MENVDPAKANQNLALTLYYLFKILPVVAAGGSIYLGYKLFILGVTGQACLSVESNKVSGQLFNAAPGLFFAVCWLVTIIMSVGKGVVCRFCPEGQTSRALV